MKSTESQAKDFLFILKAIESNLAFQIFDGRERKREREREAGRGGVTSTHISVQGGFQSRLRGSWETCLQAEGALGCDDDQEKERKSLMKNLQILVSE